MPPPPKDESQRAHTLITWNVMGLTTAGDDLLDLLRTEVPDVLVLTDTKLLTQQFKAQWLQDSFHNYHVYGSSTSRDQPSINARTGMLRKRQGQRGVLLAINRELTGGDAIRQLPTPPELRECMVHAKLTAPHSKPLNIIGIYNL